MEKNTPTHGLQCVQYETFDYTSFLLQTSPTAQKLFGFRLFQVLPSLTLLLFMCHTKNRQVKWNYSYWSVMNYVTSIRKYPSSAFDWLGFFMYDSILLFPSLLISHFFLRVVVFYDFLAYIFPLNGCWCSYFIKESFSGFTFTVIEGG
jgi:hypothetical protein